MGVTICILIVSVVLLIIIVNAFNKDSEEEKQQYQRIYEQQLSKINALESERDSTQNQIAQLIQEVSSLNDSLKNARRELDFYKNIVEESGKLNEPDIPPREGGPQLDPEQSEICKEMENSNDNFYITGKAGTGKSFLLSSFRKTTHKNHIVLAPTGLAALNVGGVTLHSVFGYKNLVNLNIEDISPWTIQLKSDNRLVLSLVTTIIIDEVSMVRADTFEKIDRILKIVNGNNLPFGGKQLLLFGDLFQLPPIAKEAERKFLFQRFGGVHFFCANAFKQSGFQCRELTINHRQKEDIEYFELLNRVREGHITAKDIWTLNNRVVQESSIYDRVTTLLPTKAEVEYINQERIRQLDSQEYIYHSVILKNERSELNPAFEASFPIAKTLRLKKGVLVMMVVNDPEHRWANGTLGIVSDLSDSSISVAINKNVYEISLFEFSEQKVIYENGKLKYEDIFTVAQYPIVPAYAITIHKSQGQTYQNVICDINKCFADGQAYVALSRCVRLSGLHLSHPISKTGIKVNKSVLDFHHKTFHSIKTETAPAGEPERQV